jgi:hypothetical protein
VFHRTGRTRDAASGGDTALAAQADICRIDRGGLRLERSAGGLEPNARSRHFDQTCIEDYRIHAEECRAMARRARSPQERDMLLNMARTWDDLATHRVEQIARKKRSRDFSEGTIGRDRPLCQLIV